MNLKIGKVSVLLGVLLVLSLMTLNEGHVDVFAQEDEWEEPAESSDEGFISGAINWVKSLFGQEDEVPVKPQQRQPKPKPRPKPPVVADSQEAGKPPIGSLDTTDIGKPSIPTETSKPDVFQFKPDVKEEEAVSEPKYVYRRSSARDPFAPLIKDQKRSSRNNSEGQGNLPQPEGELDVTSIELFGILDGVDGRVALVQDGNGFAYYLQEGDRVSNGRVHSILTDEIIFEVEDEFSGKQLLSKTMKVGTIVNREDPLIEDVQRRLQSENSRRDGR